VEKYLPRKPPTSASESGRKQLYIFSTTIAVISLQVW
jgi:hypothetical protein